MPDVGFEEVHLDGFLLFRVIVFVDRSLSLTYLITYPFLVCVSKISSSSPKHLPGAWYFLRLISTAGNFFLFLSPGREGKNQDQFENQR